MPIPQPQRKPQRPKRKTDDERQTIGIFFRVTPAEHAKIVAACGLAPLAAVARELMLQHCGLPNRLDSKV